MKRGGPLLLGSSNTASTSETNVVTIKARIYQLLRSLLSNILKFSVILSNVN